jgi:O-antigen ligase
MGARARIGRPDDLTQDGKPNKPPLPPPASPLYYVRPLAIWKFLTKQPLSFWFVCIYLFFEYVRPQDIYETVAGPPYASLAIAMALVCILFERRRLRFGPPEVVLGIFSFIVFASSYAAYSPAASYEKIDVYISWVVIYFIIANAVDTEERFLVFMLSFLIYSFKMSQHASIDWARDGFAFRNWGAVGGPGWFENSGEFGIQMCIFLPLMISFIIGLGRYWSRVTRVLWWVAAGTIVVGIVASSSRGALIGMGAILLWIVARSRQRVRALLMIAVLSAATWNFLPAEQKARFNSMGEDETSMSRTFYWKHGIKVMNENPALGIGYANWPEFYQNTYGRIALPHNVFIEAGAELGYVGLAAFVLMIGATFATNYKSRRIARERPDGGHFLVQMAYGLDGALLGFMVSGFFVTVLYYPFFWINFATTVALQNAVKNSQPPRGVLMRLRLVPARAKTF